MGIREALGLLPAWVAHLPAYARPARHHIAQLEDIRKQLSMGHGDYAFFIASRPATTKKVQRWVYQQVKDAQPQLSERELLAEVLKSRLAALRNAGDLWLADQHQLSRVMMRVRTLDDLCNVIIAHERESEGGDLTGWARDRVDQILES